MPIYYKQNIVSWCTNLVFEKFEYLPKIKKNSLTFS